MAECIAAVSDTHDAEFLITHHDFPANSLVVPVCSRHLPGVLIRLAPYTPRLMVKKES